MEGRTLLHYRILEKIGEGGMGQVYKARDESLGRLVAIKVLPGHRLDPSSRSRFFREARAASALNHPNIITIHEIASVEGTEMIVMEYVEGSTLSDLLRTGGLPPVHVCRYGVQVADALARAHAAGVIHRDLKPGNLMITRDGLIKVLDFGLAKMQEGAAAGGSDAPTVLDALTEARTIVGTVAYMSPEQAAGQPLDARSDVFSLGVVLYEMIAGRRAFEGQSTLEVLRQLLSDAPVRLEPLGRDVPAPLLQVITRAIAKDPDDRYPSMVQLRDDLRRARAAIAGSGSVVIDGDLPTVAISSDAARETAARRSRAPSLSRAQVRTVALLATAAALTVAALAVWPAMRGDGGGEPPPSPAAGSSTAYQHYATGRDLLIRHDRQDDVERAIAEFTRAVEKDAGYAPGYAGLADAYYRRNVLNPDPQWLRLAFDSATRAVELNPDLAVAHLSLGKALLAEGRLEEAQRELQRALELDERDPDVHMTLGALFVGLKDPASAERHYRQAVTLAPTHWQAFGELGQFLYKAARYEEAVAVWEQSARLITDSATIHRQLAAAYHMLGRPEEAASQLQRALQIQPSASVYNNLGTLRFFQGRYTEAVPAFEKAVEMRANLYLYWGNLGDAYRWNAGTRDKSIGAYTRAIQLASEALEAKPEDADVRASRALYRVKSGDSDGALADIVLVERAAPSPSRLFKAMVVYELAGRRKDALSALERALDAGYSAAEIRSEPELVSLRTDPRFHLIVSKTAG